MNANVYDELKWRGLVYDCSEGVPELLATQKVTLYNGFDSTANSLHIGSLVPLITMARMQRYGHTPIAVAGGGTTMIGDPSGRATERQLLSREQIEANTEPIKQQMMQILDFKSKTNPARLVNNADWLLELNLVSFLRDIGKYFTVNYMLSKDSVKTRLEREEGLSYTEFSYMLLQSYDFLHLFETHNCVMQTGGSDQWGNITAGAELIRRIRGDSAYGLVFPLITKADGSKFGKTATGTIWLAPERTSPYRFYQFWLNTDDRDIVNYLRYFSFKDQAQIEALAASLQERPEAREAQRALAREMTELLHGPTAMARAEQASEALFGGDISGFTGAEIEDIFAEVPSSELPKTQLEGVGLDVIDLLTTTGVAKSKGDARRSIAEGGIYLNNRRIGEADQKATLTDVIGEKFLVLRKGRKNYHLVRIIA